MNHTIYTSGAERLERGRQVKFEIPPRDLDIMTAITLIDGVSLGDVLRDAIEKYIVEYYQTSNSLDK
jgi:hypothetical protein